MEHILMKAAVSHIQDKEVIQNRHQGFSYSKSCLSNLVAFHDGVTETVSKGRLASVIYLNCC